MGRRRKKRNANKSGFWVVISCLIIIGIIAGLESEETSSSHTQKQQIKISTIGEYNKIYQNTSNLSRLKPIQFYVRKHIPTYQKRVCQYHQYNN